LAYQRGVFWGVVPYTPAAPFSVKFLWNYEEFDTIGELTKAFRKNDAAGDVPFSVQGKIRPILAISEPSEDLGDIAALRLANISKRLQRKQLTEEEVREVVEGKHRYLHPLRPAVVASLSKTNDVYAVIIDSPVTLHESAVSTTALGEISPEEFKVISARVVEALGLDLQGASQAARADR
jgi:hypothetical protein